MTLISRPTGLIPNIIDSTFDAPERSSRSTTETRGKVHSTLPSELTNLPALPRRTPGSGDNCSLRGRRGVTWKDSPEEAEVVSGTRGKITLARNVSVRPLVDAIDAGLRPRSVGLPANPRAKHVGGTLFFDAPPSVIPFHVHTVLKGAMVGAAKIDPLIEPKTNSCILEAQLADNDVEAKGREYWEWPTALIYYRSGRVREVCSGAKSS